MPDRGTAALAGGIARAEFSGLVLCGGRATRMGGVDKGLQRFQGEPLVQRALRRLQPQVRACLVSANRHVDIYAGFGVPVLPDLQPDFAGPIAGIAAALRRIDTPWLAVVPCDAPWFPADLVARLAAAAQAAQAPAALAVETGALAEPGRSRRRQPTFCLLHRRLAEAAEAALARGEHKLGAWLADCGAAEASFPAAEPDPFANANTLDELALLQRAGAVPTAP